jgi:hypothetical protein
VFGIMWMASCGLTGVLAALFFVPIGVDDDHPEHSNPFYLAAVRALREFQSEYFGSPEGGYGDE